MELNEPKGVPLMTAKVQKWGNSLAIRIPSVVAERLGIHQGSEMEMIIENQAIKLIPKKKKPTLEELLAKITPENRHAEIDFGTEGNELF
ncbi:AbrB/MazE/SpoVT family DNA-binding domain-containing protein [Thermosediminibacter oceani]|uniref:Transcriptional regulator/antitoxin, MazE n=1 Tax=Thermosediminibacter oceani (strain ATCC BAA-1034 / DSM 16646 / JW/IW-1228P) TaxID=555079 RepID=D9S1L9_THEOJ|nr:AbrB/MazE/SpoVT family DNA-binding domain-containing protein [Thermosediminibacter oceani]ADL07296.1 transcriptional regulator/antitoxin, MazE [Thermosediminibacter oceani DSM 16646]